MVIIERGESKFESEIKPKSGETNENRSKIPDPKRSGVGELTGRGDSQPNTSNFIDDSERFHSTSHKGMTFDEESYQFSASRLYRMSSLNEEVTSSYGAVDYVSSDGTCQKFRCLQYYMRRRVSRELLLTILASRKKGDSDAQQFINQLPKEVTGKYPWLFVRQHSVLACLGLRLSMLTNTLWYFLFVNTGCAEKNATVSYYPIYTVFDYLSFLAHCIACYHYSRTNDCIKKVFCKQKQMYHVPACYTEFFKFYTVLKFLNVRNRRNDFIHTKNNFILCSIFTTLYMTRQYSDVQC